jgi:sugar-specific transcriptional regulator TrmB
MKKHTQLKKIEELLLKLGFSDTEVAIYIALAEGGEMTIMDIYRYSGIYRPSIYTAIEQLQDRGLIEINYRGKRKMYSIERPAELRNLLKDISVDLEETLPDIEDLYKKSEEEATIRVLDGKKGVSYVFSDIVNSLEKGDTFYRYTSEQDLDKVNSYLPKNYRENRDAKKLERLVISNTVSGNRKKARLERFIKYIPPEYHQFNQNIIQLIYGDKTAIIDMNKETSIIIKNRLLADFQKTIFNALYKKL